jgi:hypothetical protein
MNKFGVTYDNLRGTNYLFNSSLQKQADFSLFSSPLDATEEGGTARTPVPTSRANWPTWRHPGSTTSASGHRSSAGSSITCRGGAGLEASFYNECYFLDAAANAIGIVATNGGWGLVASKAGWRDRMPWPGAAGHSYDAGAPGPTQPPPAQTPCIDSAATARPSLPRLSSR